MKRFGRLAMLAFALVGACAKDQPQTSATPAAAPPAAAKPVAVAARPAAVEPIELKALGTLDEEGRPLYQVTNKSSKPVIELAFTAIFKGENGRALHEGKQNSMDPLAPGATVKLSLYGNEDVAKDPKPEIAINRVIFEDQSIWYRGQETAPTTTAAGAPLKLTWTDLVETNHDGSVVAVLVLENQSAKPVAGMNLDIANDAKRGRPCPMSNSFNDDLQPGERRYWSFDDCEGPVPKGSALTLTDVAFTDKTRWPPANKL